MVLPLLASARTITEKANEEPPENEDCWRA